MKKLSKILVCLTLAFISCFALVGCKDNPADTDKTDYQTVTINNTNYSTHLSLSSFLYYQAVNTDFKFVNLPCYDWAYTDGNVDEDYLGNNVLEEGFTKPNTESFFSDSTATIDKRWKVVSFKSLKDIKIKSIEFVLDRKDGVIFNSYDVTFIISTPDSVKSYTSTTNQTEGEKSKYTFTSFWYPGYTDISEDGYIFLPKDSSLTIVFNDTKLINETYSEEYSNQNGSSSNEYSTNTEREFALNESIKCFNINNLIIEGASK